MIKNRFQLTAFLFAALIFISSMTACVKEDMNGCRSLRFYFGYTCNIQNKDILTSKVGDIRVFVFDKDNLLSDIIRVNTRNLIQGYVDADLEPGLYTFVAWAGSGEDVFEGGFMDAQMTDPQTHQYITPTNIGVLTLPDFRMMLKYNLVTNGVQGEIMPSKDDFEDLFHACVENFEVKEGVDQTACFDFIKNTNTLQIKINGLQYLGTRATVVGQPMGVCVIGKNGRYSYNNTIEQYAREVRYEPPYKYLDTEKMEIDIKVLKLNMSHRTTNPFLMYLTDPATGAGLHQPVNVVETILQAKDQSGNYIIASQEDLDRYDEFPFELNIDVNMGVSVSIFGYNVIISGQDI